jgi:nitrate reductase delta subunit
MLAFKTAYRVAGLDPSGDELPDYLPMVLDFAALSPQGEMLLRKHRADLELLRRALEQAQTPYTDVVVAVSAQLPGLGRRELGLVRTAWDSGPPREDVGIEPFAPPEYLTGYGARNP